MDAFHAALWYSFGTSCVATTLLSWHAPGLKPLGRRRSDLPPFMAAGLAFGLVIHAPYFAAPFLWDTNYRLLPIAFTFPHIVIIAILLTSFRWLARMLTYQHPTQRHRALAFVLAWIGIVGYCAPFGAYAMARPSWW